MTKSPKDEAFEEYCKRYGYSCKYESLMNDYASQETRERHTIFSHGWQAALAQESKPAALLSEEEKVGMIHDAYRSIRGTKPAAPSGDAMPQSYAEAQEAVRDGWPTADAQKVVDGEKRLLGMEHALQVVWNDHCSDTGCFPDCLTLTGKIITADFEVGDFAEKVLQQFDAYLRANPSPVAEEGKQNMGTHQERKGANESDSSCSASEHRHVEVGSSPAYPATPSQPAQDVVEKNGGNNE